MFAPFPSATAFALALGDRLTLRGLTLRRNPWTFGERVSHPLYDATHVSIRTSDASTGPHGPASPAYGTLRYRVGGQKTDDRRRISHLIGQALQHARDHLIFVAPTGPTRLVDVAEIESVAQPYPHLVGRADRDSDKADKLRL